MKKHFYKIIIFLSFAFAGIVFAAPTSTILLQPIIPSLKSTPTAGLTIDSVGLVATSTISAGTLTGNGTSSYVSFYIGATTLGSNDGFTFNDTTGVTVSSSTITDLTVSNLTGGTLTGQNVRVDGGQFALVTGTPFVWFTDNTYLTEKNAFEIDTNIASLTNSSSAVAMNIDFSGLTVSRTFTAPDVSGTFALINATQTWSGLQTFSNGLTIGSLNGLLKGTTGVVGTATAGVDYVATSSGNWTGTWQSNNPSTFSTSTGANPTATIGTTAVNGTANTFLRSDGSPALGTQFASSSYKFVIGNATTTNNTTNFTEWKTDYALTIKKAECRDTIATTSIYFFVPTSYATTTASSTILSSFACGVGGNSTTTSLSLTAGTPMIVQVSSTVGTPVSTPVQIYFTIQ